MSRGNHPDAVDLGIIAGALYLAWVWWHRGPPGFAAGWNLIKAGQGGQGGPIALKPSDLEKQFLFYDVSPQGVQSAPGLAKLRAAAPQVLTPPANGWRTYPADAAATVAVQSYAAAKASGALAFMA